MAHSHSGSSYPDSSSDDGDLIGANKGCSADADADGRVDASDDGSDVSCGSE